MKFAGVLFGLIGCFISLAAALGVASEEARAIYSVTSVMWIALGMWYGRQGEK